MTNFLKNHLRGIGLPGCTLFLFFLHETIIIKLIKIYIIKSLFVHINNKSTTRSSLKKNQNKNETILYPKNI